MILDLLDARAPAWSSCDCEGAAAIGQADAAVRGAGVNVDQRRVWVGGVDGRADLDDALAALGRRDLEQRCVRVVDDVESRPVQNLGGAVAGEQLQHTRSTPVAVISRRWSSWLLGLSFLGDGEKGDGQGIWCRHGERLRLDKIIDARTRRMECINELASPAVAVATTEPNTYKNQTLITKHNLFKLCIITKHDLF